LDVGAPTAWQRSTGAGVRIGIVDSGVFAQQEDLRPGSFTTERSPDEMPRLRRMKVGLRSERLPERRTRGPDQQFRRGGDGTWTHDFYVAKVTDGNSLTWPGGHKGWSEAVFRWPPVTAN